MTPAVADHIRETIKELRSTAVKEAENADEYRSWTSEAEARSAGALTLASQYEDLLADTVYTALLSSVRA